ncbi:MAG: DUF1569 domain-containing protein [Flavobacterium sp.]|jgi:hypothetical protein
MKSIFTPTDNLELQNRLQQITADSLPIWGKMNAAQMFVHCQKPFEVAEKKLILNRNLMSYLFGSMMKKKLLIKGEPFTPNLPTAKAFLITDSVEFAREKNSLLEKIIEYSQVGPSIIKIKTHPFFGDLSPEQWGILFYKHLDHHLKQFSV